MEIFLQILIAIFGSFIGSLIIGVGGYFLYLQMIRPSLEIADIMQKRCKTLFPHLFFIQLIIYIAIIFFRNF